jgi:hypothetical protein
LSRGFTAIQPQRIARVSAPLEKHVRPTVGELPVARLDAETIDSLYASLKAADVDERIRQAATTI